MIEIALDDGAAADMDLPLRANRYALFRPDGDRGGAAANRPWSSFAANRIAAVI